MMTNSNLNITNVMIDIETLGLTPGSSILSIGAAYFTTNEKFNDVRFYSPIPDFYVTIDRYSCIALGLIEDSNTISWWNKQSAEARADAFSGTDIIVSALLKLSSYIKDLENGLGHKVIVWANGANFDFPLLEAAYNLALLPIPWRYHNVRCYRTLKALATVDETSFQGVKHNALADAKHQAVNAVRFLASLEKQNVPSLPT